MTKGIIAFRVNATGHRRLFVWRDMRPEVLAVVRRRGLMTPSSCGVVLGRIEATIGDCCTRKLEGGGGCGRRLLGHSSDDKVSQVVKQQ